MEETNETAELLAAAAKDGVTVALTPDGRVLYVGDGEAKQRHQEKLARRPFMEIVGVIVGGFIFNVARTGFLDGHDEEFLKAISDAAGRGMACARKEVEDLEARDDPPNAS